MSLEKSENLWAEICYILSENISKEIDESAFQREIIRVLEKLGWSQFRGEIVEKPCLQIGSTGNIYPDILVQSLGNHSRKFIIEVKKPAVDSTNDAYTRQLYSYMRQVKCELGLIIGDTLSIYLDEKEGVHENFTCLKKIPLSMGAKEEGSLFVQTFSKDGYEHSDRVQEYVKDKLHRIGQAKAYDQMRAMLLSDKYQKNLVSVIRSDIAKVLDEPMCDKLLDEIQVTIKTKIANTVQVAIKPFSTSKTGVTDIGNSTTTPGVKDSTRYLFDGKAYGKGKLALAIVKKYVQDNPHTTYNELQTIFPKDVQGSHGVFVVADVAIKAYNRERRRRHFLATEDLIRLADATIAVSTQWGIFNISNIIEISKRYGYEIAEVK
ncbi:hypothetical protein QA601_15945 [Chitinispirillales bacterium ANBcel5]|uniref:hypothetical protein n=1 Tax=Cellulosispirillum alkaliphilum TaxID=3039283 RepID=UPI002A53C3C2|nr:hypothetical protein [Chitinispirillales bacterium ANBcel5]